VRDALVKSETLEETVDELRDNLTKERKRTTELEDELVKFQRRSREDDDMRDRALADAKRDIRELAERVAVINKPRTEADGAAGAATVINAARKRETWFEVAKWVAIVIVYILTLLGVRLPKGEPTEAIPVPTVRPAGTGPFGTP
jgi:hypothetical protein